MSELFRRLRGRRNLSQRTRSDIEQDPQWPDHLANLNWRIASFHGREFEYVLGHRAGGVIRLNDTNVYFTSSTDEIRSVFDKLRVDYNALGQR